jgi:hypothetical protein
MKTQISNQSPLKFWVKHPSDLILRRIGEIHSRIYPDQPWISHHAIAFLKEKLNKNMIGLEWGSGRNTAWCANRIKFLTGVEHNPQWYEIVKKKLQNQNVSNIDYQFIALDHPETDPTFRNYPQTPDYVAVAEAKSDESLDFVVIDGHYRLSCVKVVLNKIKPNGYLLIDNSNWMELSNWGVPTNWKVVHRSFGFYGETTIWQKPNSKN